MRRIIFIVGCVFMLASCKPEIPAEVIPQKSMEDILVDIHYVDGFLLTVTNIDTSKALMKNYYNAVYKKYNIDSTKYAQSMDYYYKNPKLLDEIYKGVTAKLDSSLKHQKKLDSNAISK